MRNHKGFSLIELLSVVAIIGILSAIALPMYRDYITRGKLPEAFSTLADMRVRMEIFFQDNPGGGYTAGTGACADPAVAAYVAGAGVRYFTYTCNATSATTFVLAATGKSTEGTGGFTYTLNEQNQRATTAAPSGWTASATCWIRRKDGAC